MLTYTLRVGLEITPYLPALARLRLEVFREYPYLYHGDSEYERLYARPYVESPNSLFVLAWDGNQVVGISTGIPLSEQAPLYRDALTAAGYNVSEFFYFGESVLLKPYRGQGAGRRFFDEREGYARALDFAYTTFYAVVRRPDDPRRPADYISMQAFWRRRGYVPRPDLLTTFSWREAGQSDEIPHTMQYWIKKL